MTTKHVVLVGLPGAGKSTVGRAVSERLGRPFVDLDRLVERTLNKRVSQIFDQDGELAFRAAEAEASRVVAQMPVSVIAPGGGWALNPIARAHLVDRGRIIYLRVTPEAAVRRMGHGISRRPLLASAADPYQAMRAIYGARRAAYESCADLTVDTGGMKRSRVVTRVVELVLAAEQSRANYTSELNDD